MKKNDRYFVTIKCLLKIVIAFLEKKKILKTEISKKKRTLQWYIVVFEYKERKKVRKEEGRSVFIVNASLSLSFLSVAISVPLKFPINILTSNRTNLTNVMMRDVR